MLTPPKVFKTLHLIKIGILWAWKNLWAYGRKVHAKFWPWGMPWDPIYDHFCVSCWPSYFSYWIHEGIWGVTGPGRYLIFFLVRFRVECNQNHVWEPPGARVMSIFVKTYIFARDVLDETHGWKERQKLYRMVFSKYTTLDFWSALWAYCCDIILWHYDILIICVTYFPILYCIVLYYKLL